MSTADLYLGQVDQFERALHEALADVTPLVAESALGKAALANVLIAAAVELLVDDGGTTVTRKLLANLTHIHLGAGSRGTQRSP